MNLIFGIHCHQPLGNFDWVIDQACDQAYLPFVETMARHPGVPFNVHYSGCLLEWLDDHRPDVTEALQRIGDQAEWMTGGFYEPIFPVIPHRDRVAQIELLSEYLDDRFGQQPSGMWLPERVWDPSLPASLAEAGVRYVPVDDFHFLAGGYRHLDGYYVTDHLGSTLSLFPISQRLRYTMPMEEPDVTVKELRAIHEREPDALAVMADDGEKFGVWPGTNEWMYGPKGWLERFLRAVERESSWLRLTTFERFMAEHSPSGQVAIPPASYFEMTQWALPARTGEAFAAVVEQLQESGLWQEAKPFVRGGYWPNFQMKYPESNAMYRKMLRLSKELAATRKAPPKARTDLLRGQCNCSYWHGVFGGLYLAHIRADVHQRLIAARTCLDETRHRSTHWSEVTVLDWDGDGREEVHVELPQQSWVLDQSGAMLYRDDKPGRWSLSDVVARRFEAYHPTLSTTGSIVSGERGSIDHQPVTGRRPAIRQFVYDRNSRRWLLDHLLPVGTTAAQLMAVDYEERLPDLSFEFADVTGSKGRARVVLRSRSVQASLEKTIRARGRRNEVTYRIDEMTDGWFGPEIPVSVWEGAGSLNEHPLGDPIELEGDRFTLLHEGRETTLSVRLQPAGRIAAFPLRTISKSEAGYDEIMQGVILWPHWQVEGTGRLRLELEVGDA